MDWSYLDCELGMRQRLSSSAFTMVTRGSPLSTSFRFIRTQIPPRPVLQVMTYLTKSGRAAGTNIETDVAIVRTRENKFYLQRVLPEGEVVRFRIPGLDHMSQATHFETFSIPIIDVSGGVHIPNTLHIEADQEPHRWNDAVLYINMVKAVGKWTRKDKRSQHRELFAHWKESPAKFQDTIPANVGLVLLLAGWGIFRWLYSHSQHRSFFDSDLFYNEDGMVQQSARFAELHPEHTHNDTSNIQLSPGQVGLGHMAFDLNGPESSDMATSNELLWKITHCIYYGHWPKGVRE